MKTTFPKTLLTMVVGACLASAMAQTPGTSSTVDSQPAERRSQRGMGPGPGGRGGRSAGAAYESVPMAKDEVEKKILAVLEEMHQAGLGISAPRDDARFLRMLIESMGAKHAVELGTFRGYSSIWMCLGLTRTGGKLTTFEIDKENANLSRRYFQRAGVESLVTLVEGDAHREVSQLKGPIDLVFIDADKEGYVDYLNQLLPLVRPGGLVVAHNIDANRADPAYIKAITTNANLESLFLNLGGGGLSVSMKKR